MDGDSVRVLETPKPLIPLNPLLAPTQPRIPRALGAVFVGNPFLKLPEVTAQIPKREALPEKPEEAPAPKVQEPVYGRQGKTEEKDAKVGSSLDLKA